MKVGELQTTKFLKKEDFPEPRLVTISRVAKENVAAGAADQIGELLWRAGLLMLNAAPGIGQKSLGLGTGDQQDAVAEAAVTIEEVIII